MTTTTAAKLPTGRGPIIFFLLLATLAIYGFTQAEPDLLGWQGIVLGAAATFVAFWLVNGIKAFLLVGAVVFAPHVFGATEAFQESWRFGFLVTALVSALLAVVALVAGLDPNPKTPAASAGEGRRIVGLSGYGKSGKDTAAKGLLWAGFTRASFADVIRRFCYAQNPLVQIVPSDPLWKELTGFDGITGTDVMHARVVDLVDKFGWERVKFECLDARELLQRTGTDAGRKVLGDNVWVDAVMADLPEGDVVLTDCRFPNEVGAVKRNGGLMVRVIRPGVFPVNGHVSEHALDNTKMDVHLHNDGDAHALGVKLRNIVKDWPFNS